MPSDAQVCAVAGAFPASNHVPLMCDSRWRLRVVETSFRGSSARWRVFWRAYVDLCESSELFKSPNRILETSRNSRERNANRSRRLDAGAVGCGVAARAGGGLVRPRPRVGLGLGRGTRARRWLLEQQRDGAARVARGSVPPTVYLEFRSSLRVGETVSGFGRSNVLWRATDCESRWSE